MPDWEITGNEPVHLPVECAAFVTNGYTVFPVRQMFETLIRQNTLQLNKASIKGFLYITQMQHFLDYHTLLSQ